MIPDKMRFHTVPINHNTIGVQVEYLRQQARAGMAMASGSLRFIEGGYEEPTLDIKLPENVLTEKAEEILRAHNVAQINCDRSSGTFNNALSFAQQRRSLPGLIRNVISTNQPLASELRDRHEGERLKYEVFGTISDVVKLGVLDLCGMFVG